MSRTVAAITGASSGLGAEYARKLAAAHDLLLIARRRDRLEQLAAELSRNGNSHVEVLQADLTEDADLDRVARRIGAEERLALLVNNAGFGTKGRFWEAPLETQEKMHRLHVMATVRLTHAALGNMVPRDYGAVINVASISAFARTPGTASYAATKSWMTAFTEGLYLDLRSIQSNVVVQALCPGLTYSEFHDTMRTRRERVAPPSFWMSAEQVVQASLDGLGKRQLIVVPGWRYRLITTLFSKLPTRLRLSLEFKAARGRLKPVSSNEAPKQIG